MKLNNSYNQTVQGTYIIHIPDNPVSVMQAERCLDSCRAIGQSAQLHVGFSVNGSEITVPQHLQGQSWIDWFRVTDHYLSSTEVACCLSHISLWIKCIELDQPIVILEHDAVMVKPYTTHSVYNAIEYLGCAEQHAGKYQVKMLEAPRSSINTNWHFIHRAHAYSIDPAVARKMLANVIHRGIFESLDVMIRSDDYAIYQTDLYAYEKPDGLTTIFDRKK